MNSEVLEVEGWKAIPSKLGGYDIYSPGCAALANRYRGHAPRKDQALEWLDESTGAAYRRLPGVRIADLRSETGDWERSSLHRNQRYRNTVYYLGDKRLGTVTTTCTHFTHLGRAIERVQCCTFAGSRGVLGSDLVWMLKENGFRVVT